MGRQYDAKCKKCGKKFTVRDGGGFIFHLLHCDKCGREKSISFDEIGEPHLRYIKGLDIPYCIATSKHDEDIQKNYPGEPLSEEEYNKAVEKKAGKCDCGGRFRFDALPRCPKCGSLDLLCDENSPGICFYD